MLTCWLSCLTRNGEKIAVQETLKNSKRRRDVVPTIADKQDVQVDGCESCSRDVTADEVAS